jgi:quinol monooxygenase YgiN
MELSFIARFHVRDGETGAAEAALAAVAAPTRAEEGCLEYGVLRAQRDPRLFFIHSRWRGEAAFDAHAELPHTRRFIEVMETLTDQPTEMTRCLSMV